LAETDVLKTHLSVKLARYKDDEFIFRIPSIADDIKLGLRMRDIRIRIDPTVSISEVGIDFGTSEMLRACAAFEILLEKTSASWVYQPGATGPTIDSTKFSTDRTEEVMEVYYDFQTQLATFRRNRFPYPKPPTDQAVAGSGDSGTQEPVQG
jgi:hypothetical protein